MIQSKKVNIIVAVAMIFALMTSIVLVVKGNLKNANDNLTTEAEYAAKIFDTDIISIEIISDEADWQEMLDNATSEQYIMADVVVNGTKFQNVGIRPKGNSSLTQVARNNSDRYSFRLQFDEYIKGQTCFGLESFVLNNMLGDNTYMKEYVSYELMREIGVNAPYFGYADIKVNGESWGLYLAVELYNESYEQRVFGDKSGMLYNVKSMDIGGNQPGQQAGNVPVMPTMQDGQNGGPQGPGDVFRQRPGVDSNARPNSNPPPDPNISGVPEQIDGKIGGMDRNFGDKGGRGGLGGSLEYTGDNTESYSAIFNNVVGKGTESDFQRVVLALKALSESRELEEFFDVDQILRYLAAHTIVVNLDSYSSSMAQNYYIYERDGQITILPWDYNLAWGGFQSGDASSVVNFPIDTPLSGVEISSRPLIEKLFANTEYLEKYHSYLQLLIDNYFANGKFDKKISTLNLQISDYVKNDATAFCTYDNYRTAVSTFITLGNLRAESIQGQLAGTVPSTTAEQSTNSDQLVSVENLKLSSLGSMMGDKAINNKDFSEKMGGQDKNSLPGGMNNGIDTQLMSKAIEIIRQANGNIQGDVKEALVSLGLTTDQIDQISAMASGRIEGIGQNSMMRNPSDWNGTILNSVLTLILISAILCVARFRKSY